MNAQARPLMLNICLVLINCTAHVVRTCDLSTGFLIRFFSLYQIGSVQAIAGPI